MPSAHQDDAAGCIEKLEETIAALERLNKSLEVSLAELAIWYIS
jgi:hypothetical protein